VQIQFLEIIHELRPNFRLALKCHIYEYLSLAFVCLKIYSMSLIINIIKQNIKNPHNIGIQNPDLSILIRPMEIDVIERKVR